MPFIRAGGPCVRLSWLSVHRGFCESFFRRLQPPCSRRSSSVETDRCIDPAMTSVRLLPTATLNRVTGSRTNMLDYSNEHARVTFRW